MRKIEFTIMLFLCVAGFFLAGFEHSAMVESNAALKEQRETNIALFHKYVALKDGVDCNGFQR